MTTATENMVLIPGGVVLRQLRDGLVYQLGLASNQVGVATDMANPELHLSGPLERFDRVRSLLEELAHASEESVSVGGEHWPLIAKALRGEAHTLADMARDARAEGRGETASRRRAERDALIDYLIENGEGGDA